MSYLDGKLLDSSGIVWLCLSAPPPLSWVVEMIWSPSQRVTKPVPAEIFTSPRPEILSLMFHGIWASVKLKLQHWTLFLLRQQQQEARMMVRCGPGARRRPTVLARCRICRKWVALGAWCAPWPGAWCYGTEQEKLAPARPSPGRSTPAYTIHQQYHYVETILRLYVNLIPWLLFNETFKCNVWKKG